MKTFDICSGCLGGHHWREIDYDNVLYMNIDNAICLTLCPACVSKFLAVHQNKTSIVTYKRKVDSILKAKPKPITHFKNQSSGAMVWSLFY